MYAGVLEAEMEKVPPQLEQTTTFYMATPSRIFAPLTIEPYPALHVVDATSEVTRFQWMAS